MCTKPVKMNLQFPFKIRSQIAESCASKRMDVIINNEYSCYYKVARYSGARYSGADIWVFYKKQFDQKC